MNSRRSKFPKVKLSNLAIYASVFVLVLAIIFTGYQPANKPDDIVKNNIDLSRQIETISIDDVVAANIAANIAEATNLPIANNVANLAVSAQITNKFLQTSGDNSLSPVAIGSSIEGRSIISYTVQTGESMGDIISKFGISKETIMWANNLTSVSLYNGQVLQILPIDGVVYDVRDGDTVDSLAEKYKVDKERLILYNDLDLSGLVTGRKIILPNATLPANERPGYIAPRPVNTNNYFRPGSEGNRYAAGNCTWWAYERRAQLGRPVGSFWGNANTWTSSAISSGYTVNNQPAIGAILSEPSGWYGHVSVVEVVRENGDVEISEMNNYAYGGWNIVSRRTISAGQANLYNYIH